MRDTVNYRDMTVNNRNPLKRFVQQSRFRGALRLIPKNIQPETIIDYGGGNGELCRNLAQKYPKSRIICYEPADWLQKQAEENLKDFSCVSILGTTKSLYTQSCDLLFCLEVFEHLPPGPLRQSLSDIYRLIRPSGIVIISVPIEIFFPALLKGIFRILSGYQDTETTIMTIIGSVFGRLPSERKIEEISPGVQFYFSHSGFDYRVFMRSLQNGFSILKKGTSPFSFLGAWFNSQVYFVCSPKSALSESIGSAREPKP